MPIPQAKCGPRHRTRILSALSYLSLGLLAACSESATIASEEETFLDLSQAQILAVTGASQEGEVGTFLSEPLTVEVRSQGGTPMAGVAVEWVFQAGQGVTSGNGSGGSSTSLVSYTDSRGRTAAAWLLGTTAGTQQSSAQVLLQAPSSQSSASGAPAGHSKGNKVGFSARAKPGSITSLDVTPGDASLRPGESLTLSALAKDEYGNPITDAGLNWRSSDANVATVDGNGVVTALSTGQTLISAKSGPVEDFASVTSIADGTAAMISTAGQNQTGTVGQALPAAPTVEVRDAQGQPVPNVTVTWTVGTGSGSVSSATTSTDASGHAGVTWTLGTAAGPQSLRATTTGLPAITFNATAIAAPVAAVLVSPAGAQLDPGQTLQASAEARDAYGNVVSGKTPGWSVSNPSVLQVDVGGRVTALASGTAEVRATIDGVTGSQSVTVTSAGTTPPAGSYLEASPSSLWFASVGESAQLSATVKDAFGNPLSGYTFAFSSSNSSIVGVDSMGRVTAKAAGTAMVFVSTVCCSISDTVAVEVAKQEVPQGVWLYENWDYPDAATMKALPGYDLTEWGGPVTIQTGTAETVPFGPPYKYFKAPASSGVDLYPEASPFNLTSGREFWMDAWIKFDPNWRIDWGAPGNPDHKTFLFFDSDGVTTNRHDFHLGVFANNNTQVFNVRSDAVGHSPYTDIQPDLPNDVWDGQWHRLRFHADLGDAGRDNGTYEIWLDGTRIHSEVGTVPMPTTVGSRFVLFALGRNVNIAPTEATHVYWGPVSFYRSNPGW